MNPEQISTNTQKENSEKSVSEGLNNKKEKGLLDKAKSSLKKTLGVGMAVGMGYLGTMTEDTQAADKPSQGDRYEQKGKVAEKIDANYVTNMVQNVKGEIVSLAESDDERDYKNVVKKIEIFWNKLKLADTPIDSSVLDVAAKDLTSTLEKIKSRIVEVTRDKKATISQFKKIKGGGNAYGVDLAETRKMRIRQEEQSIEVLNALNEKIVQMEGTLSQSIKK